ncbi:DNA primase [Trichocoleus sp. ST-U1]|uniref:DNA primase n=1 Tax=Trichocoleus sp. ST-U1 TaxID=2933928 RepID=UPI0032974123
MQIPRLHPDTIEEVKQRADIVDVISEYVLLRKQGKDFVGLCPFHEEKSPSFSVSPSKQMYYCFGCQAGGNVITFLKEHSKRSLGEVVLDLARRYQVPVQMLEPEQRQELQRQITLREQLHEILAVTASFYQYALRQAQGQVALEYLRSKRELSEETIQQFHLGYAPADWETLYRYLVEQKHFPVQLVEQAGLIVPRKTGSGYYDRFRDRLMIPIHDSQGRVIAFGGRTLGDEQPKYLNSPETELFHKGKTLFALDKARDAIGKQDQAVVVEGYFDAIALHAAGISNVVASLGTALSLEQVRLLLRYTESKQIIFNFDADAAGTKATQRAIGEIANLAYQGQVNLRILNLPDGKDADEFIRKGGTQTYRELLLNAPLWLDWQIQQILIGKNLKQADQFQQVTGELVKLLNNLTNDDQITYYINHCAEILSQGDSRRVGLLSDNLLNKVVRHWEELLNQDSSLQVPLLINNLLKQSQPKQNKRLQSRRTGSNNKRQQPVVSGSSERSLLERAEALLLRFYLHCPEYRQAVIDVLEERDLFFSLPHYRFLWLKILDIQRNSEASIVETPELISSLQNLLIEFPEDLAQVSPLFHLDENTQRDILSPELIKSAAACMERVMCENIARRFLDLWKNPDTSIDPKKREYYCQEFYKAKQRIKELDGQLQFSYFYR